MSYSAKILLDSISPTGKRLTTMEVTFPRCVLAEAETHRVLRGFGGNVEELTIHDLGINVDENLSRNSASSRAIPINKMIRMVQENPFIPEKWGKPVAGMGAKEYWSETSDEHRELTFAWTEMLHQSLETVEAFFQMGNKEDLNRLLEPFMWHTAILTATEWDNFFKLRTNSAADWKIRKIADLMYAAYHAFDGVGDHIARIGNKGWSAIYPQKLKVGEWHCPLVYEEDEIAIRDYIVKEEVGLGFLSFDESVLRIKREVSVARCARVSYLTHDGKRDIEKDLELFERLRTSGHWSPFEHVATPYFYSKLQLQSQLINPSQVNGNIRSGNFIGWKQFRKEFADENCTNFRKEN